MYMSQYENFLLRIVAGLDPLTGLPLLSGSKWSDPEIKETILAALKEGGGTKTNPLPPKSKRSLEPERKEKYRQRIAKTRETYPNAYNAWTSEEDVLLQQLVKEKFSVADIATRLGRQNGGVVSRMEKLGLSVSSSDPDLDVCDFPF